MSKNNTIIIVVLLLFMIIGSGLAWYFLIYELEDADTLDWTPPPPPPPPIDEDNKEPDPDDSDIPDQEETPEDNPKPVLIKHEKSNRCLTGMEDITTDNHPVVRSCDTTNELQHWIIDGSLIKNKKTGHCLDGRIGDNSPYVSSLCEQTNIHQSWSILQDHNMFRHDHTSRCLDAGGDSNAVNRPYYGNDCTNTNNQHQKWTFPEVV